MLFIDCGGFGRATLTLSPRPEHRKHAGGPSARSRSIPRSAEAVPRIVRQDFHWVKTDWAVVLLMARCGRTVLLEETALSVGSADNVTVHPWLSYGRSVSRF